mmetsp:Transcript_99405/g.286906  ORF Transcript_99405/g.286906 Transcript_99405/m.286906 type:complete len:281 (+) Transcript_99405:1552-2394(+)
MKQSVAMLCTAPGAAPRAAPAPERASARTRGPQPRSARALRETAAGSPRAHPKQLCRRAALAMKIAASSRGPLRMPCHRRQRAGNSALGSLGTPRPHPPSEHGGGTRRAPRIALAGRPRRPASPGTSAPSLQPVADSHGKVRRPRPAASCANLPGASALATDCQSAAANMSRRRGMKGTPESLGGSTPKCSVESAHAQRSTAPMRRPAPKRHSGRMTAVMNQAVHERRLRRRANPPRRRYRPHRIERKRHRPHCSSRSIRMRHQPLRERQPHPGRHLRLL